MTRYVALCARLSPRPDGSYEGVDAQIGWGMEYAAQAWPDLPVEVFADRGISASNGDERPEHERFRQWLADGKIAQVWSVEQSRLERREVEWFQLAAELDAAGIIDVHTRRDGIVRVRDEVAGIKAVLNAGETRKMKRRINDRLDVIAAEGAPPGSRPFGYAHAKTADGVRTYVIVEAQAEAIRTAAELILAGWSRSNIAAHLNEKGHEGGYRRRVKDPETGEYVVGESGHPVTRSTELTWRSVTSMVTNPTVAGYRVHRGRIVGRGNWPAILDEDTWQAVKAKLKAPHVVQRSDGGTYAIGAAHFGKSTGRRYLLTGGLVHCEVCDAATVVGTIQQLRNKSVGIRKKPYLICHPRRGGKGCVGIMMPETDAYVVESMLAQLEQPEFLDAVGADSHGDQRQAILASLDALERRRTELAAMWALPPGSEGSLSTTEWQTAKAALTQHEQALRADLAQVPPPLVNVDLDKIRSTWPKMTLDEQREVLRLFVHKITIRKAKPGTKGFDPGRVVIEWRPAG